MKALRLPEDLLVASAYPDNRKPVRLVETHISYLFFTERFVYKVKKPVDLGFLDFSTLEKRLHYCLREIELNRRLSPRIYLGLAPISFTGRGVRLEDPQQPVEFAVKMLRLDSQRSLSRLLDSGDVDTQVVGVLAKLLAFFHSGCPTGPEITRQGNRDAVQDNVQENFEQIQPYCGRSLEPRIFQNLKLYSEAFLRANRGLFEKRAREGWIREGHGDLHAGNIFLDEVAGAGPVQFIDCIEFSPRFRCSDVVEDIAFLAMDFDHYGRQDLSQKFVQHYLHETKDQDGSALLDFFKCYRAAVRGKVISFRLEEEELAEQDRLRYLDQAGSYFELANSYAVQSLGQPFLVVLSGLMGSGKSALGSALSEHLRIPLIASDPTRKKLAGVSATHHQYENFGEGIYSSAMSERTYTRLFQLAGEHLGQGRSVILDASFSKTDHREKAFRLAEESKSRIYFVHCQAPEPVLRFRLQQRSRGRVEIVSDGRLELLREQKQQWEPLADGIPQTIELDTNRPIHKSAEALLSGLFELAQLGEGKTIPKGAVIHSA